MAAPSSRIYNNRNLTVDRLAYIYRIQAIPLGRLGQPEEVVATILFLLSRANSHITGQVIGFNGGELMT